MPVLAGALILWKSGSTLTERLVAPNAKFTVDGGEGIFTRSLGRRVIECTRWPFLRKREPRDKHSKSTGRWVLHRQPGGWIYASARGRRARENSAKRETRGRY